ncbi:Homeotic protein empty spiracles [Folsomia candida]|uniref:Homeotic protein empty spiracles n=1 Tax=Folsomia candida TaxID=158441 RepID=A0A226EI76_FOLCA|nr:Homeotic protein empty spiracles [Folsomia candida]
MMPLAPTSTELPAAHRPKIGFSIDSIVGGGGGGGSTNLSAGHRSHRSGSLTPPSPEPSSTEISAKTGSPEETLATTFTITSTTTICSTTTTSTTPPPPTTTTIITIAPPHTGVRGQFPHLRTTASPPPAEKTLSVLATTLPRMSKSPLVFSSPNQLPPPPNNDQMHHHSSPPNVQGHPPPGLPPHFAAYPPGMLNFAVQAAAAAAAQSHHHPGLPWMGPPHPHPHHPHHPGASAHPLYPWLLAKHSRLFPHRFGPGPELPGFLLQPFRKPKRIRTAFSPSQLLKLEIKLERRRQPLPSKRGSVAQGRGNVDPSPHAAPCTLFIVGGNHGPNPTHCS